jgi:CRP-like cAMP-binding protein
MALDDDIAGLASAPILGLFERDALRLIAFASEGRNLKAGEVLFRRGDRSDGGYVVLRGALALDAGEDGSETAFVAERGALVGRSALFVRTLRPATATAREPSAVLRISPTLMRRVLEEFPDAAAAIRQALVTELALLSGGLEQVRRSFMAIDGG